MNKALTPVLAITLLLTSNLFSQTIYYVNPSATGANDGSSWTDAYTDLHDGLTAAVAGDQVWVATGSYIPTRSDLGNPSPADPRTKTFLVPDGVDVYGGFAGTEGTIGARNIATNPTVLSGDIGVVADNTDNCYHVVLALGPTGSSIGVTIDGFTITGGNADNNDIINLTPAWEGGGMYLDLSGPSAVNEIKNNTIIDNSAEYYGGIYLNGNGASSNIFTNNNISNNSAIGSIGFAGGLYINGENAANNTFSYNTVTGNLATNGRGGGLYLDADNSLTNTINNNTFSNNTADFSGGGMYLRCWNAMSNTVNHNIIMDNTADSGGGLDLEGYDADFNTVNYNTVTGNSATTGTSGGILLTGSFATNKVNYNIVINNSANTAIGGIAITGNNAQSNEVINNIFIANSADVTGGLSLGGNNSVSNKIINNTFSGNYYGGFVLFGQNASNSIISNTVYNNGAYLYGGLRLNGGGHTLSNNIIWGNNGPSDQIVLENSATININNSIVEGGWTGCINCPGPSGDGNINPLIADESDVDGPDDIHGTADDGLTIRSCSPAIDAGTNVGSPVDDITGYIRNSNPDIGAYEFQGNYSCSKYYVDESASGSNNGSSWIDAFTDLQDALNIVQLGDSIWVADGTYLPSLDPFGNGSPTDSRDKTFFITDGVHLYGGFAGGESSLGARNIPGNPTILSGDIGIINDSTDNVYHVLLAANIAGTSSGITIDGFTVRNGNADGVGNITLNSQTIYRNIGAGIFIRLTGTSSVNTVINNTIINNSATAHAGMVLYGNDAVNYFSYNTILNNYANNTGGISLIASNATNQVNSNLVKDNQASSHGGMSLYLTFSSNNITHNSIINNSVSGSRGGMYIDAGSGTNVFTDNEIIGNSANSIGGLSFDGNQASNNLIENNIIINNSAIQNTGGMYFSGSESSNTISNNTFFGNAAQGNYGALTVNVFNSTSNLFINNTIYANEANAYPGVSFLYGVLNVSNNIVWNNSGGGGQISLLNGATATVSNSIVEGGWVGCVNCPGVSGDGNIDPRLANTNDPDGNDDIHGTADDGISLRSCSPAIDAGTSIGAPAEDITGYLRDVDPDIGAYEFQGNFYCSLFYVDSTATGSNDGSSWADAFTDLQSALSIALSGDTVWVAKGTYFPTLDPFGNASPVDTRDKTFFLNDGVFLYGGFAGNETSTGSRNILANPTILDGNIGDSGISTDNAYHVVLSSGLSGASNGVTIDGFTVIGGNANGASNIVVNGNTIHQNNAGGLYISTVGTSAINHIKQNTIIGNSASNNYGGMYLDGSQASDNTISHNVISNNSATNDGGGLFLSGPNALLNEVLNNTIKNNTAGNDYGGLYLNGDGSQNNTLLNNIVSNNSSINNGGGLYIYGDNAINNTVNYNTIKDNTANNYGGIYLIGDYATNELVYNTIIGNTATASVGGMHLVMNNGQGNTVSYNTIINNIANNYAGIYISGRNSVNGNKVNNNTIHNNSATGGDAGGLGMYADNTTNELTNNTITNNSANKYGGGVYLWPGNYLITNTILWRNTAVSGGNQIRFFTSGGQVTATVNNSIVEGGWTGCNNCPGFSGDGNIDPLLADLSDVDGLDDIHRTADDGLTIKSCSPAIDAGTNTGAPVDDITGFSRGSNPDIGAYENQNAFPCLRIYVDSIAMGINNGSSWVDAYTDLQDALVIATAGDSIWVAKGTYKPSALPPGCTGCSVLQDFTFFLRDGVRLYGGFAGTESLLSQRNIPSNLSILSGDVGVPGNNGDNCFHVVLAAAPVGANSGVTIDGFTITEGNAAGFGSVNINGNSCFRNAAGGVYIVKEESAINEICNNTIIQNSSTGFVGGVYVYGHGAYNKINNNTINNNSGTGGGGLRLRGEYALNEVSQNTINDNSASTAPAIYMQADYATNELNHNNMSGNSASNTAAIYLRGRYAINVLDNNNISNNTSSGVRGGIWLDGANADSTEVTNNIINDNTAGSDYGGVYWDGTSASYNTMSNNTISGNTAGNGYGGLYFEGEHAVINSITGNIISNNIASNGSFGGARVYCFSGTGTTKNNFNYNTISGNSAAIDYGGLYMYGGNANNNINSNTILQNTTSNEYGGMYIYGGKNDTINRNIISGNMAGYNYGGLYVRGSSVTNEFNNNVISDNSAVNNHGGMTFFGNFSFVAKIINNTIYGNSATNYGGLSLYNGNFTTSNNIFWDNNASGSGSQFFANFDAYPVMNNSIIEGGWPICISCPGTSGDGDIDPLIVDVTDFDGPDDTPRTADDGLSIQYYSPAINAGTTTDAPTDDITGYTRDANPDIGAYENNHNEWTGSVDTNWDNPSNWSMGVIPHMGQDAYINPGSTHFPVIVDNAYCRQLLVPDGAQISLNSGGHLQTGSHIQIGNGVSGQITMNGGTLTAYDLILKENSTFIHHGGGINLSN